MVIKCNKQTVYGLFLGILLIFSGMNFLNRYYWWVFLSFALMLCVEKKVTFTTAAIIIGMFSVSLLFREVINLGAITTLIKSFTYLLCYLLGFSLYKTKGDYAKYIVIFAIGMAITTLLNLIMNWNATDRNTVDIWVGSTIAATGQASRMGIILGVIPAMVFVPNKKYERIVGVVFSLIIIIYNSILAGRTLYFMMLICMAVSLITLFIWGEKKLFFRIFVVLIAAIILSVYLYYINFNGLANYVERSNFIQRMLTYDNRLEDSRFSTKILFFENFFSYMTGGCHLREMFGYAHELYLDCYDEYGLLAYLLVIVIVIGGNIKAIEFLRNRPCLYDMLLTIGVFMCLNILFFLEPILQGPSYLFAFFCFLYGMLDKMVYQKKKVLS